MNKKANERKKTTQGNSSNIALKLHTVFYKLSKKNKYPVAFYKVFPCK